MRWVWLACTGLLFACTPQARLHPYLLPAEFFLDLPAQATLPGNRSLSYRELPLPREEVYQLLLQGGLQGHLAWSRPGFVVTPELLADLRHRTAKGMRFFYARLEGDWPLPTRANDLEPLLGCQVLGDRALRFYLAGNSEIPFSGREADLLLLALAEGLLQAGAKARYPEVFNPEIAQAEGLAPAPQIWEMNLLEGQRAGFLLCRGEP